MKKQKAIDQPGVQFLIALAVFYLLTIIFFNKIIFAPNSVALSPDYLGALSVEKAGELITDQGETLWSPYYFGGMPLQASLQIPVYTYTGFNTGIVRGILSILFIRPGLDYNVALMLFHFIMTGAFVYLLARSLRFSWLVSILCGVIYMFTPSLIVLTCVGHGSKLFTSAYIPLVFLTVKRMLERRKLTDFALFSLAVGMTLLSLHVQVGFYALLAAGMYLVWSMIFDIRGKPLNIPFKAGLFIAALTLGICFASSLYFPLYEYSPYSIRGGSEEALSWEYATSWSFHPLESLAYIIPSFFGFGGQTYWGYMPFTDMPIYWGLAALIFSIVAAALVRNRIVTFFLILFLFSWIVSFGKFFPVLFKPMFEFMPFFNRFRVPVMIQILMIFSVSILCGFGLEKIREIGKKGKNLRWAIYSAMGIAAAAVIVSILSSPLESAFAQWIAHNRPNYPPQAIEQIGGTLFNLAFGDVWKAAVVAVAILGSLHLFFKGKIKYVPLVVIIGFITIADLWLVNRKLVSFSPEFQLSQYFQPSPAVKFLRQQEGLFRIYPVDNLRSQNWYGAFGLQSVSGYMGTKMKRYQAALDGVGLNNFNFLNLLNCRYILHNQAINHPMLELVIDGEQKVYRNNAAFPRAWLVHKLISLPEEKSRFDYMNGGFNPAEEAIVEEPIELSPGVGGTADIKEYSSHKIVVETSCATPSFLVLSETYYPPYWKAKVDGNTTRIYPTDQLLRGVKLPAGEHTVEFTCSSPLHKLSQMLHAGAMLAIILMLIPGAKSFVMSILRRNKRQR